MITRTIVTPEHQLIKLSPKQTLEEGLKIISDNSFLSLPGDHVVLAGFELLHA